jgi:hypothetical protein
MRVNRDTLTSNIDNQHKTTMLRISSACLGGQVSRRAQVLGGWHPVFAAMPVLCKSNLAWPSSNTDPTYRYVLRYPSLSSVLWRRVQRLSKASPVM